MLTIETFNHVTLHTISDVERHGNQHKIYKIRQYTMGLSTSRWQRFSAATNCYQSKFHIFLSRINYQPKYRLLIERITYQQKGCLK